MVFSNASGSYPTLRASKIECPIIKSATPPSGAFFCLFVSILIGRSALLLIDGEIYSSLIREAGERGPSFVNCLKKGRENINCFHKCSNEI